MISTWIVATLAVAAASYTITRGGIFESFRVFVEQRSVKLGELFRCPYCLAHWLAFGAAALIREPVIEIGHPLVGLGFTVFAVICLVSFLHFGMLRAYSPVVEDEVRVKLAVLGMQKAAADLATEEGHPEIANAIMKELKVS